MHVLTLLTLTLAHFTLSNASCPAPSGCGTAQACIGTEFCTTATFVSPSTTTITTCVPTATCAGHPAPPALVQPAVQDTAPEQDADRRMTPTRSVVRTMGLVLQMTIVVMAIFVWKEFVRDHSEIQIGAGADQSTVQLWDFVLGGSGMTALFGSG
ncbi:uncharacterized protein N7511_001126 [Penicillium nucicola]|uniref:uncharacterized protein n=1 Tax=Penicillium nucicola TaxID=1850975 RepID=UPI002544DD3E|nr:uncharacterized protein N7511_001126 [Penicillium nucicola]KAJ5776115.1 hypothetical protein N7511_001126 [Penicillium nucicola]